MNTKAHDIDMVSLATRGDALFGEIDQLREHDPLYWSEQSQSWIVTGHAELMEGFSGELPLSNVHMPGRLYRSIPEGELEKRIPHGIEFIRFNITNMDGEDHARVRKLLVKALNRKLVESLRPYVQQRVAYLLDNVARQGEIEFNEGVSRQLPGAVILRLLGLPEDYLSRLKGWAEGVNRALGTFDPKAEWLDELEVVIDDMRAVFLDLIAERRREPREDLTSQLISVVEGGTGLSEAEMLSTLILVVVAGHDTTSNSLTLGMRAMATHPEAWAYWRAHPEKSVEHAIELMRYISMSSALPRLASADFEWRGRRIRKGDLVMMMMVGGNRDPSIFREPERLDLTRENKDAAMTFAPGLHHCVGHLLAKLQLSEFFTALVQRFDSAEILETPAFLPMLVFRNVTGLKLRFHPRAE